MEQAASACPQADRSYFYFTLTHIAAIACGVAHLGCMTVCIAECIAKCIARFLTDPADLIIEVLGLW
jgi:hypothetical protein